MSGSRPPSAWHETAYSGRSGTTDVGAADSTGGPGDQSRGSGQSASSTGNSVERRPRGAGAVVQRQ